MSKRVLLPNKPRPVSMFSKPKVVKNIQVKQRATISQLYPHRAGPSKNIKFGGNSVYNRRPPIHVLKKNKRKGNAKIHVEKAVHDPKSNEKRWYKEVLHNIKGPALIMEDGSEFWYKEGVIHRNGDVPAVTTKVGKYWYKNGKYHRENGPAIVYNNGKKEYYLNGVRAKEVKEVEVKEVEN